MWTLLQIALRNVARNRRRTLITLAAVLVGVGVMVTIRGFLNGLQEALVVGVVEGQTGAIQIHRKGYLKNVLSSPLTLDFAVDDAFLAKLRGTPGVKEVAPRIQFAGMVNMGDDTLFMQATGVDPKAELAVCPLRWDTFNPGAKFGGPPPPRAADAAPDDPPPVNDGIILTNELSKSIGAKAGVQGALLAPDRDSALSGENMHVTGTMTLNFPGEKKVGLVPLPLAQRLLKMDGRATEIAVAVKSLDDAPRIAEQLQKTLGDAYEVHTWDQIATFIVTVKQRQNFVLSVIAAVFMVLMLLGVANTMLMSVLERTREIGTMMAVGVRRQTIMIMFLLEAFGLGTLGGLVGAAVGAVAVLAMNHHGVVVPAPGTNVPFTIRPFIGPAYLLFVTAIAAVGAVGFASYPAYRASRLRPVEALAGQ